MLTKLFRTPAKFQIWNKQTIYKSVEQCTNVQKQKQIQEHMYNK